MSVYPGMSLIVGYTRSTFTNQIQHYTNSCFNGFQLSAINHNNNSIYGDDDDIGEDMRMTRNTGQFDLKYTKEVIKK